jgi:hypothetical protein
VKRAIIAIVLLCAACGERPVVGNPPVADVEAVVEKKPAPTESILTDPAASARYNAAIEAWGDRVSAAGGRLCRYFANLSMAVDCPAGK